MKTTYPHNRGPARSLRTWGGLAAVAAVFLMGSTAAFAAPAPANTVIGNQASASYLDANGNSQVATSNIVQTTVQQVGSFALDGKITTASPIDVVNNQSGGAGATIYMAHTLTNTGNGSDSFNIKVDGTSKFSKVEIYNDSDGNGLPDNATPLCTITSPITTTTACSLPSAQTVAGSNGQFKFVVAYTIPSTATATGAFDVGNVTVTPASASASMYASTNQTVSTQDAVTLTTSAAFSVSKAISLPANGINPSSGSWPTAINNGKRTPAGTTCATDWSTVASSPASCVYTTFTITYSNKGGATGKFVMKDVIGTGATAGLTYVPKSAVWSNNSGTALGETAGTSGTSVDFVNSSGTLTFVDNSVPVNTTRSVSFVVQVNSTATVGTGSTTNSVTYNATDAGTATVSSPGTLAANSNSAAFTVNGTYSIAVGTSSSASSSDAKDSTAGTPGTGSTDTQTIASVSAGKPAVFTYKVYNLGNDTDSVNIAISGTPTFPSGTTYRYYKADGTTELADTNNDGKVDTGPIPLGGSVNIVVKAFIPPSTLPNATAGYSLTVLGTSGSDSSETDAAGGVVTAVVGPFIDMTNTASGLGTGASNDDVGTGPSTAPTVSNANIPAGSWTTFSLFLKNNDSDPTAPASNSYDLSASSTTNFPGALPSGWVVKFAAGNVASTGCSAATAITNSGTVNKGQQQQVTACVFVPATQVVITQAVYFQAKAASNASDNTKPADIIYDEVKVIAAATTYSATLTPNNNGQVQAGGSVVYAHTLTATGTGTCGAATVTVSFPAAAQTAGWTYALYQDVTGNGTLDSAAVLNTTGAFSAPAPGTPVKMLVKVFAPGGAAVGASATATVSVTFPTGTDNCGTPSATDASSVVAGPIRLVMTQAINKACDSTGITTALSGLSASGVQAKPGECVVYRVVATNEGTAQVTNLLIQNSMPAYTTLSATQPGTVCESTNVTPAFANPSSQWPTTSSSVSCTSTNNTVNAGGTATLTFQVQINQ